jgi:UDP-N-acetylglucosamine acyltransferase
MIGGIVSITKDVLPYSMLATNTVGDLQGMNIIGMRRAGIKPEDRKNIKQAFKLIFHSGLNLADAMTEIEKTLPAELSKELADFVEGSTRGLCRPAKKQ